MLEQGTTNRTRTAILWRHVRALTAASTTGILCACAGGTDAATLDTAPAAGAAGTPYPEMPATTPIGERIGKYLDVPETARGPAITPGKGDRLQDLGSGLYMVTDNAYQSMFLVHDRGVVVIDAPPSYAEY